jgi:hypothetical protein
MVGQRCRNQNLAPVPTLSLCQGACVARLLYLPLPGLTGGLLEYGHEDAVAAARSEYEECVRCGNEGTAFFGGPCFWKQGAAPPEGRCTSHHCGICLEAHGGICRPSPAACTSLLDVEVFGDNFDASFGPSNMPVVQRNFNLLYRANRDLGLLIFDECKVECAEPACGTHVRKVGNGQVITNQEITCEDADETALAALGIDTSEFTSWKSSQGGCQGALFAMNQVGKTCSDDMSFFAPLPPGIRLCDICCCSCANAGQKCATPADPPCVLGCANNYLPDYLSLCNATAPPAECLEIVDSCRATCAEPPPPMDACTHGCLAGKLDTLLLWRR